MNLCLNIMVILCILFVVIFILVCIISFIENRRLTVTTFDIKDYHIPKEFSGFKIVQLTDMHNASFGKDNCRLISKVRELHPDIIVITGDMIIGHAGSDVNLAADTMNSLSEVAPVYFSMGNHELRVSRYIEDYGDMWERFIARLSPDIHLLFDKTEAVYRNGECIYIHGVSLVPKLYTRLRDVRMPKNHLRKRFGVCDTSGYHIFLAHNPEYFKDYVDWGANLTFSGHVHGGIVRIPFLGGVISPKLHLFPEYDKGKYNISDKYMILSSGLGNHTMKFRVNNLPEIVLVTLIQ